MKVINGDEQLTPKHRTERARKERRAEIEANLREKPGRRGRGRDDSDPIANLALRVERIEHILGIRVEVEGS